MKEKQNQWLSVLNLFTKVHELYGVSINPEIVRRGSKGYDARVAKKQFYVSEKNWKNRRSFTKSVVQNTLDFWKIVSFVDVSKIIIFGSDGRVLVRREEFPKQFTIYS